MLVDDVWIARWDPANSCVTSMTKELSLDVGFRYVSFLHESHFRFLMLGCSQS